MTLAIRPAIAGDRVALVEQVQLLNLFEEPLVHDRRLDRAGAELALDRLFERIADDGGAARVAVLDGAVVGHLFVVFERWPPYVREDVRSVAYVADLFVREALRGQGIGRALLAEAETIARAGGMARMAIGVVTGNDRAERAYRAAGYVSYAVELMKELTAGGTSE